MTLAEWIATYLDTLPPLLRSSPSDDRLAAAAETAHNRGWPPATIAKAVAARDYNGALHPTLIATQRLTDLAAGRPPGERGIPRDRWTDTHCGRPSCSCTHDQGCHKGWLDDATGGPVGACWNCRPQLARALKDLPPPGQRNVADLARLREREG